MATIATSKDMHHGAFSGSKGITEPIEVDVRNYYYSINHEGLGLLGDDLTYRINSSGESLVGTDLISIGIINDNWDFLHFEILNSDPETGARHGLVYRDVPLQANKANIGRFSSHIEISEGWQNEAHTLYAPEGKSLVQGIQELVRCWMFESLTGDTPSAIYQFYGDCVVHQSLMLKQLTKEIPGRSPADVDINQLIAEHLGCHYYQAYSQDREGLWLGEYAKLEPDAIAQKLKLNQYGARALKYILKLPKENALRKAFSIKLFALVFNAIIKPPK